jgi:hypothetical protein
MFSPQNAGIVGGAAGGVVGGRTGAAAGTAAGLTPTILVGFSPEGEPAEAVLVPPTLVAGTVGGATGARQGAGAGAALGAALAAESVPGPVAEQEFTIAPGVELTPIEAGATVGASVGT